MNDPHPVTLAVYGLACGAVAVGCGHWLGPALGVPWWVVAGPLALAAGIVGDSAMRLCRWWFMNPQT